MIMPVMCYYSNRNSFIKYEYIATGSVHAADIPYTFGYPLLQFNDDVRNNTGMTFAPIDYDDTDVAVSEFMMTLWTNFAKFG